MSTSITLRLSEDVENEFLKMKKILENDSPILGSMSISKSGVYFMKLGMIAHKEGWEEKVKSLEGGDGESQDSKPHEKTTSNRTKG